MDQTEFIRISAQCMYEFKWYRTTEQLPDCMIALVENVVIISPPAHLTQVDCSPFDSL